MENIIKQLKKAKKLMEKGKPSTAKEHIHEAGETANYIFKRILPDEFKRLNKLIELCNNLRISIEEPKELDLLIEIAEKLKQEEIFTAAKT